MYQALISGSAGERGRRRVWRPPVEVFENGDSLEIVTEIAGMRGEDIDIVVEGDLLTIEGDRQDPTNCEHRTYHIARIGYGPFAAEIHLPFSVETENAEASYENGFLRVILPKAQVRTIIPTRAAANTGAETEKSDA
jgi:HSP20 family protein